MDEYDHHETYCRSLGGCVFFSYCRVAGGARPCSKILDCWIGRLPVVEFLKNNYSAEVLEQVFAPQPGRIQRILDTAEKVAKSSKP